MIQNVGMIDRLVRIAIGLALLAMPTLMSGGWKWIGLIGFVPLFTALAGWCPAYSLLGIKTCSSKN